MPTQLERLATLESEVRQLGKAVKKHGAILERIESHVIRQEAQSATLAFIWQNIRSLPASAIAAAATWWATRM